MRQPGAGSRQPGRIESVRDLRVWQEAMDLSVSVYQLTRAFPRDEQFGLTSQARRAAVSIAANIAEGYGRGTRASYASFLRIARGSLREVETHLLLSQRLGFGDDAVTADLLERIDRLGAGLHGPLDRLANPKVPAAGSRLPAPGQP